MSRYRLSVPQGQGVLRRPNGQGLPPSLVAFGCSLGAAVLPRCGGRARELASPAPGCPQMRKPALPLRLSSQPVAPDSSSCPKPPKRSTHPRVTETSSDSSGDDPPPLSPEHLGPRAEDPLSQRAPRRRAVAHLGALKPHASYGDEALGASYRARASLRDPLVRSRGLAIALRQGGSPGG